jgi:hypothetical protein
MCAICAHTASHCSGMKEEGVVEELMMLSDCRGMPSIAQRSYSSCQSQQQQHICSSPIQHTPASPPLRQATARTFNSLLHGSCRPCHPSCNCPTTTSTAATSCVSQSVPAVEAPMSGHHRRGSARTIVATRPAILPAAVHQPPYSAERRPDGCCCCCRPPTRPAAG